MFESICFMLKLPYNRALGLYVKYRFEAHQSHMRAAAFELCRQALVRFGIAYTRHNISFSLTLLVSNFFRI